MPYPLLFSEGKIGNLVIKNRFIMPPMVRNYADADGGVTDRYVAHIERIAKGGVGAMIIEASYVAQSGKGFVNQLGIQDDAKVAGLRRLADVAHAHHVKIGIQLYHGGRQASSKASGSQPIAPSAIPDPVTAEMPHPMDLKVITAMSKDFGAAARRAKEAGFDFVEIHGAHGYLIAQFLSPFSNKRNDLYGGSFAGRMRFLTEVYKEVRKAVGKAFPVTVRISGDEMVPGGIGLADAVRIAKELEKFGADAVHVSAGNYASYAKGMMIPPMAIEDGPLLKLAATIKKALRKMPVIAVAKIRTPELAEKTLASGKADFIAVGRMLLADPEYPNKVADGRVGEVNGCIACNQGCISRLFAQQDVWCTVNPEAGREQRFAKAPGRKRKVLVIGGGPAGLSAAKTAALRGHEVVLYEKTMRLGGQLMLAGILPKRGDWLDMARRLESDVRRLGVYVSLGTDFTPDMAKGAGFDQAIIAMGSSAIKPNIPGVGRTNVIASRHLLAGWTTSKGRVVVVGGGCAGAQTAESLAEKGHPVTIVEATGDIAAEAPIDDRMLLLGRLEKLGVKIMRETKVLSIGPKASIVEGPSGMKAIPADTVVLCLGSFPNDGLLEELRGMVRRVDVVGDGLKPRRVTDAVEEGALAVLAGDGV